MRIISAMKMMKLMGSVVAMLALSAGCASEAEEDSDYCLELWSLPESTTVLSCTAYDPYRTDPNTGQPLAIDCRPNHLEVRVNEDGLSGCVVSQSCGSPDDDACDGLTGADVTIECSFAVCAADVVLR